MIIQEGKPESVGVYVVYTNGPVERFAERIMLIWHNDTWYYIGSDQIYRGHIYGFIGPLPAMEITA